jgi:hypothetical protein
LKPDGEAWQRGPAMTREEMDRLLAAAVDREGTACAAALENLLGRIPSPITYHDPELSAAAVVKEAKCAEADAAWAVEKITALRELHRSIDEAVRDAYGWKELELGLGFHELEFLPEEDRVRFTVSAETRREILRRLLTGSASCSEAELQLRFPRRSRSCSGRTVFSLQGIILIYTL